MTDCSNAEMRDALPELPGDRIDAGLRARVEAHVATCADCAAEVALLHRVRRSGQLHGVSVDVDRIVRALPTAATGQRRMHWAHSPSLRIAATFALLIGGATWYAGERPRREQPVEVVTAAANPATGVAPAPASAPVSAVAVSRPVNPPVVVAARGLSLDGSLDDFSDKELQSLLSALDSFDAQVGAEPETVGPVLGSEGTR